MSTDLWGFFSIDLDVFFSIDFTGLTFSIDFAGLPIDFTGLAFPIDFEDSDFFDDDFLLSSVFSTSEIACAKGNFLWKSWPNLVCNSACNLASFLETFFGAGTSLSLMKGMSVVELLAAPKAEVEAAGLALTKAAARF